MSHVKYNLNVRHKSEIRIIARISIDDSNGDIYYIPMSSPETKAGGDVDHVSFHRDGRVHVVGKNKKKIVVDESGEKVSNGRIALMNTGYQLMVTDHVPSLSWLPTASEHSHFSSDETFDLDVVQPLMMNFSMISGRLIVSGRAEVRNKGTDPKIIDVKQRSLGVGSGNQDKLLQYTLEVGSNDVTSRTLVIPYRFNIIRD